MFIIGGPGKNLCAGGGEWEDMCERTLLAAACADDSGHLALVNPGDGEIVSKGLVRARNGP